MTISAEVVADSIQGGTGSRLTTLVLTYPRPIHPEFLTHRDLSRNASSSRAIPVEKMLAAVRDNPFVPIHWGKNQPGMQAREELDDTWQDLQGPGYRNTTARGKAKLEWLRARNEALLRVENLLGVGLHKQIANRLLEPFGHITVVVTGTRWANFFGLRCSNQAEPHMEALAEAMLAAMNASEPNYLEGHEWHLPFFGASLADATLCTPAVLEADPLLPVKLSVARCARVSYLNHDKTAPDTTKDIELHDKLLSSGHMSPFEHQAYVPMGCDFEGDTDNPKNDSVQTSRFTSGRKWGRGGGNLGDSWVQYRKLIENEVIKKFDRLLEKGVKAAYNRRYNTPKDPP